MIEAPAWAVALAVAPVIVLTVLVLRSRPLTPSAWIAAGVGAVLGVSVYGLTPAALGTGVVRGLWTGAWILLIVLPALLLFEVLAQSGALDELSAAAQTVAPTEGRRLLLLAWVLPAFLQGAAGFATPIAVTAPMLVRGGMAPVAAVATCLLGYQWAVTFGSMGSSFFMASATARLGDAATGAFALRAAVVLAITCVVSGLLVLRRANSGQLTGTQPARRRDDLGVTLVLGVIMGLALLLTVGAEPAIASTVAGLAGLVAAWWLLPRRGERPDAGVLIRDALPYLVLTGLLTVALGVAPIQALLARVPPLAPVLPGSTATFGHVNPASPVTPAFEPLQHPLPYLLLATLAGVIAYRRQGRWRRGATRYSLAVWARRCRPVTASILGLTILAAVMTEAGMLELLAGGLADLLGRGFLAVSALVGTLGTTLTGSTTASNALFSSLQASVATRLDLAPEILLTAQTAGGNIGNALAPVAIAVGAAAAGCPDEVGTVVRRNLPPAALLLAIVVALTTAMAIA